MDAGDYSPASGTAALSEDSYLGPMMKKMNNRKRFSDEQVRSLESMFDEETKLEPRKKLQLARDLGLEPRQIAIWFQNRRARWKSKHLEQEYNLLRANYDDLAASLESLHKEKQCLLKQLQELKKQLEESQQDNMGKNKNFVSGARDTRPINYEDNPRKQLAETTDLQAFGDSDGESSRSAHRFQLEKVDSINIGDVAESSIRWPGEWPEIDTSSFSDQSCSTIEWWDFWA